MVGEAMGRVMADGGRVPSPIGPEQRTVVGKSPLEEGERIRGQTNRHRGAVSGGQWVAESIRVPTDRQPTARGTLASTPILHTLVYMFDNSMSGSVLLRESDGTQHAVYFQDGAPAKARTGRPTAMIGAELVAANAIHPDAIPSAVDASRRLGTLFGEYLVGEGQVSREQLGGALQAQVINKVASLVNLPPETDYAFYQDLNVLETWAGGELTPCHPLNAILASARSWYDRARIRATLGRIAKQPLSLHPQSDLSLVLLTAEESAVVDAIRTSRTTITTLYQEQIADEEAVSSLVYALAVTRCFAFTASRGAPMGARALLSNPPPTTITPGLHGGHPPTPGLLGGHPQTPGSVDVMAPGPSNSQIISARPAPSSDSLSDPRSDSLSAGPSSAPGLPSSQRSAPRVNPVAVWRPANNPPPLEEEAPITSPPTPSSAPGNGAPDDGFEVEDAEAALQAMTDFRLAETALQRNDTEKAERLARKAVAGEPSNAEYVALLTWIHALSGTQEAIQEAIAKLCEILKDDALCERALLYRGKLYKRTGKLTEAIRDFQTVLDVNPRNSEAASEARLLRTQKKKK
jgi:tetratricopeptide (TPR) repeat protein